MDFTADLDLDRLRVPFPEAELPPAPAPPRPSLQKHRRRPERDPLPRHRPGERFLKGPIPMRWLGAAMRLRGKALHVALAIWQRAGMTNSPAIKLNLSRLDGVTHSAGSRGLAALEKAGLVTVVRMKGQSPVVALCEPPSIRDALRPELPHAPQHNAL